MTGRHADIGQHIGTVRQLGVVVNAMRGIAAARAQQGRALLPAIRAFTDVAARALGQALSLDRDALPAPSGASPPQGLILFGAEQGFAGAFADQILDAAAPIFAESHVFLVGSRTAALARDRDLAVSETFAAPLRAAAITEVAGQLADAVYAFLRTSRATRIDLMFPSWRSGQGLEMKRKSLLPLDRSAIPTPRAATSPLVQLPVPALLEHLGEEYVFALLCEAAVEAFAAENEARAATMAAASSNIDTKLADLQSLERSTRQDDITSEVVELASAARSRLRT